MILHGDCLEKMKELGDETVDLVYLDPPFYTQKNHTLTARDSHEEFSFEDTWASLDEYLRFMKLRLAECKRVLKSTGSLFLHCDKNAAPYLRTVLDEVFGMENFRNEIIWSYRRWTNAKSSLQNYHQNIYFYSKSNDYKFHVIYDTYAASTNIDQILQKRVKNEHGKSAYKTDDNGDVVFGGSKKGVPLGDVWYIPYLNPKASERVGYPTQKPILLLERIIRIATDKNDVVLDPFCGSGTTLVAAHLQNRRYIGIDKSPDAVRISRERIENPKKTISNLLEKGESGYINKTAAESHILRCLGAVPVQRNSGIDGFLSAEQPGKVIPVKIQKHSETLLQAKQKLMHAAGKRSCDFMILIKTHHDQQEQHATERNNAEYNSILVIDSYELSIERWLSALERVHQFAMPE